MTFEVLAIRRPGVLSASRHGISSGPRDSGHPAFFRMVELLKRWEIHPVTVWNGRRPVTLETFLES
jgi:hypothetical protein